jgi:hypothetical protein
MFDPDNPPKTYNKFRKEILRTIEDTEVDYGEEYPTALFIVDRDFEGDIIYIEDVIEEVEEDIGEEPELPYIIETILPDIVQKRNSKFFAMVFPGTHGGKEIEIVSVLCGAIESTNIYYAEVVREKGEPTETEPWIEDNILDYPNLSVPFRRAIVIQG